MLKNVTDKVDFWLLVCPLRAIILPTIFFDAIIITMNSSLLVLALVKFSQVIF